MVRDELVNTDMATGTDPADPSASRVTPAAGVKNLGMVRVHRAAQIREIARNKEIARDKDLRLNPGNHSELVSKILTYIIYSSKRNHR